jgi:predicted GIY-YIG superfamily endonuclease
MDASFSVYILASKPNGTLHVGVTNNLARRLSEHKAKLVPGFTPNTKLINSSILKRLIPSLKLARENIP